MTIKDNTVEQVKDVAWDYGAQRHEAPILAQSMNAERLGDDGGEDAKEEPITKARQARHKAQEVRILDVYGAELSDTKEPASNDKAPSATGL
jgi:hypothetical protein